MDPNAEKLTALPGYELGDKELSTNTKKAITSSLM
jgi:hypothetical protein